MTVDGRKLFQLFKYIVYTLLAINIYIFFAEESLATKVQFPGGVPIADLIEAFAATIDTAAWVLLLLMFELETYVLDDKDIGPAVGFTLHAVRVACYSLIIYAFYGYVINLIVINQASIYTGINDMCSLVSGGWSYAVDLDEYTQITAANCSTFSSAGEFLRFADMAAVVDVAGFTDIYYLAWVDVINAAVWLLVVLVLEIDVRLQQKNRLQGVVLQVSKATKYVLYSTLLLAAIYWGFKGDFVDFWDAFLWLVAFVFIELNVFEWRHELEENAAQGEVSL